VPTALVTGASAGLGRAFAERLAAGDHDLVVVARDAARLGDLAADLQHRHGASVEVVAADLTDRAALGRVADRLSDPARPVDLLVNNAGNALRKPFVANDVVDEEGMLDLHVRATLVLTHAAVRAMADRGQGGVINVASVAGWLPQGTYSAHKAWVTAFSQGVAAQVERTGVRVMALEPGFVRTEFHERAGIDMRGVPEVAWLSAPDVVEDALDALGSGRVVYVPSLRYKAVATLLRNTPYETLHRLRRVVSR
jgi:uncharacterized protein